MDFIEIIRVSLTAIQANRMRSILTMLGIVIGVFSVILLVALVSGLKTTITSQISGLGSNLVFVVPGSSSGGRGPGGTPVNLLTFPIATEIKTKLRGEADVSPVIMKASEVVFANKNDKSVSVAGVEDNYPLIISSVKLTEGRFINTAETDSGKRVTVIGQTVVTDLFPNGEDPLNKSIQIDNLKYKVIGVLGKRGSVFGQDQDNTALVPLVAAQKQFGINNPNFIYVSAKSPDQVTDVENKTKQVLLKHLSADDFTVQTQDQTLSTISQVTGVLTAGLGGVAAISLIVGGIGIMNIMLVSVTERTREIGLRKALGATPSDIRNQFLVEAITLSGMGGVIGIILGILASLLANNFIQTTVTWWSVALSFGFSMLVGVVFGVTPAIRASKLTPSQALRYE